MWCKVCSYGNANYKFDHCGQCGGTDMVKDNPFTEAKKNPRTLRDTRKDIKNKNRSAKDGDSMTKEIDKLTRGSVKSRDYQSYQ